MAMISHPRDLRAHRRARRSVRLLGAVALVVTVGSCGSDGDLAVDDGSTTPTLDSTVAPERDRANPVTSSSAATTDSVGTTVEPLVDDAADRLDAAAAALEGGEFTMLLDALSLSGLADDLEERSVTILAPSDDAFRNLVADDLRALLADPSAIDDVLQRHVLTDAYSFEELKSRSSVDTMAGATLPVSVSGTRLDIGGATVTEIGRGGASPVEEIRVYAIDQVLIDP